MKRFKQDAIVSQANWHPNFRIDEALPDLKVVRTGFFINAVSLSLVALVVFFVALREYKTFSLKREIATWQEKIDVCRSENMSYLELSKAFKAEKAKFEEVRDFVANDLIVTEFLGNLSPTIPEGLDLDSMAYGPDRVVIRGTILGNSETASIALSEYLDVLRENPEIGPRFEDISLTSLVRDASSEVLNFEIVLQRMEKGTAT